MAEEEQHVSLLAGLEAVQGRLFLQGASPGGDPSWGWDSPEAIGEGESVLVELRQGPPYPGKGHPAFRCQAVLL